MSFGLPETQTFLDRGFPGIVAALCMRAVAAGPEGVRLRLPAGPDAVRPNPGGPPLLSGQAMAAAVDTAAVLALSAANGRFRNCGTVDLAMHFLRPVTAPEVELSAEVLSNGRRMGVVRVDIRPVDADDALGKLAVTATLAFAYLAD